VNDIVCISPVDGGEVARRRIATDGEIAQSLAAARQAQREWSRVPLAERKAKALAFLEVLRVQNREIVPELAMMPEVLVDVDHTMRVMMEESFGPVVGIMKVPSDEAAVRLMNDSPYGLTASVWTADADAAERIGDSIATGTVFMNRCDYVDPSLAWTGIKDTGRGASMSRLGFEALTRPKSFHLRIEH
jgi:acyl-CoA reductase-like NAD-dependent aldehyde dehydrogenase